VVGVAVESFELLLAVRAGQEVLNPASNPLQLWRANLDLPLQLLKTASCLHLPADGQVVVVLAVAAQYLLLSGEWAAVGGKGGAGGLRRGGGTCGCEWGSMREPGGESGLGGLPLKWKRVVPADILN
jgi:hypothetical protein